MRVVVINMQLRLAVMSGVGPRSRELTGAPFRAFLVAANASIEAALEPVKLIEGICTAGCDIGSRFALQTICLD
jgi:hypothetical protein